MAGIVQGLFSYITCCSIMNRNSEESMIKHNLISYFNKLISENTANFKYIKDARRTINGKINFLCHKSKPGLNLFEVMYARIIPG